MGLYSECMDKTFQYWAEPAKSRTGCINGVVTNCGVVLSMWEIAQREEGTLAVLLQLIHLVREACEMDFDVPLNIFYCVPAGIRLVRPGAR